MTFTFELDVTEVEQYAAQLRIHADTGARAFAPIAEKYQRLNIEEMRRTVPVSDTPNGSDGISHLRDEIKPEPKQLGRTAVTANIVIDKGHAGFVEYGTVKMAPQPYVRPALAKYRKPYEDELVAEAKAQLGVLKGGARRALRGVRRFGE